MYPALTYYLEGENVGKIKHLAFIVLLINLMVLIYKIIWRANKKSLIGHDSRSSVLRVLIGKITLGNKKDCAALYCLKPASVSCTKLIFLQK